MHSVCVLGNADHAQSFVSLNRPEIDIAAEERTGLEPIAVHFMWPQVSVQELAGLDASLFEDAEGRPVCAETSDGR